MQKIGQFIYEMDMLLGKVAFVPAPQQGGGQSPVSGGSPQGGDPSQQGGAPQSGGGGMEQLLQQLPPEVAQQIQQMPPDQQQAALQQVMQQMQGGGQGGDPAAQGAQQQPGMPQDPSGGDPNTGLTAQDGSANAAGHVKAENQLDNTQVTLSVRELMDITSGGKATQALLAVKQMASKHNSKMQQDQQKMQMDAAQAQMQQQAQSQGMMGGGIYPGGGPDMSGKPQAQPAGGGGGGM